jgi:effector-binding domain-containing protein
MVEQYHGCSDKRLGSREMAMTWSGKVMAAVMAGSTLLLVGLAPGLAQQTSPASPSPKPGSAMQPAPVPPPQPDKGSGGAAATDLFGEEVTLTSKPMIFIKGTATWDTAFDTLVDAFKSVQGYVDREKLKPAGPFMTIYTATDDTSFQFKAGIAVETAPKEPPKGDLAVGTTPEGRALKFVHRGPYDSMDATYDAITNYLDDKKLDAKDLFVEQYETDPLTTAQENLVIDIYVPVQAPQ